MELSAPLMLVLIGLASLLAQWLAWLLRLPAILPLLLFGIVLGPTVHLVQPDLLFGDLLFPLVSLSVAIILFEGALTLRFEEIRGLGGVVRNLVTVGMLVTFLVISLASWWLLDFPPELAALIGAVTVVTGPTVIAPLMRVVRPNANINQVLRWEGIVIDPVGAIFTLLVFRIHRAETECGVLYPPVLDAGRDRRRRPDRRRAVRLPARPGAAPRLAAALPAKPGGAGDHAGRLRRFNAIADESGLLTVTVMGIWLANMRDVDTSDILAFKRAVGDPDLGAVHHSGGAARHPGAVEHGLAAAPAAAGGAVHRSAAVHRCIDLALFLHWRDRLLLCWIAPRIVAAAVSSLFALTLQRSGYQGADRLVTVVFAIIIGTVVLQSLTSGMMARWLRVQQQKPRGVLIVGANSVARMLAQALIKLNVPVIVTDSSWEYYRQARMDGIPAYYGHAYSNTPRTIST